jgi:hypothetical protein
VATKGPERSKVEADASKATESTGAEPKVEARKSTVDQSAILKSKVIDPLLPYYNKIMILLKRDSVLSPWLWNANFTPSEQDPQSVSLEKPSPFRIVDRTLKSYHGYVVDGEVQEAFFDNWNNSEVPDVLTISPVVIQDQLVAAVLAIGDKNMNQKTSLQNCEKSAEILKQHMIDLNTQSKSA